MIGRTPEQLRKFGNQLNTEANNISALVRKVGPDMLGKPTDTDLLMRQLSPEGKQLLEAVVLRAYAQAFWIAVRQGGLPIIELPSGHKRDLRMVGRRLVRG